MGRTRLLIKWASVVVTDPDGTSTTFRADARNGYVVVRVEQGDTAIEARLSRDEAVHLCSMVVGTTANLGTPRLVT
ncbi:MAG: hypothetical protein AMXMBFR57_01450 [Acidimicrobiia bacterium]